MMLPHIGPWQEVMGCMALGIILGLAYIGWQRISGAGRSQLRPTAGILEGQQSLREDTMVHYERTISRLKELDEQGSDLDPQYVRDEREQKERLATQLLLRLQAHDAHAQQAQASAPQLAPKMRPRTRGRLPAFLRRHPQAVGMIWGVGLSVVCGYLLVTVQEGSAPRPSPPVALAAESASGGPQLDRAKLDHLQQAIASNPNDLPSLLELAHMLLRAQMLEEAQVLNDRALKLAGNNLEALTHAAVLSAARGEHDGAMVGLAAVLKKDPGFVEAWFFRGMLSMQVNDIDTMRQSLQEFVRLAPDGPQKERVRAMLARFATNAGAD